MGKNNVNPDHYKTAGRERQGEDIVQEQQRQKYAEEQARTRDQKRIDKNALPNALPPKPKSESRSKKGS